MFRFGLVDVRDLDGESLLASENVGDNVIAILTRLGAEPEAVRRVLKCIAQAPPGERDEALAELSILAGLRNLGGEVRRETGKMPIQEDIRDHDYFGPIIRHERAEGLHDGQIQLLMGLIEERFGLVPPHIRHRLGACTSEDLTVTARRIFKAERIEDLFTH